MADESNEQKGSRPARPAIPPFRGPGSTAKPPLAPPAGGGTRAPFLRPGARPGTPTSPLPAARATPVEPPARVAPPTPASVPEPDLRDSLPVSESALPSIEEFVAGGAAPTAESTVAPGGPSWLDAAPAGEEPVGAGDAAPLPWEAPEALSPLAEEGLESAAAGEFELPPPSHASARTETPGVVDAFELADDAAPTDAALERADAQFPPTEALGEGAMGEVASTRTWSHGTESSSFSGGSDRAAPEAESAAAWSGDPSTWPTPVSNPAIPAPDAGWGMAPPDAGHATPERSVGAQGEQEDASELHAPLAEDVIPATMDLDPAIDALPPADDEAVSAGPTAPESGAHGYSAYGEASIYAQDAASDWEGMSTGSTAMLSTGGEPIARVLELLAARIRNGVLVVPEVNAPTEAAALAAVLGALLGVRSGRA